MSEQKRVIVLQELAPEGIELLRGEGLLVESGAACDPAELLRRVPGCRALIAGPGCAVGAAVLRAGADLQVVGRTGPDAAGIDVAEATRRGVVVITTPESNAVSAAEQALALLLACARDLAGAHADLRAGRWEPDAWTLAGVELRGRTLRVLGAGQAGPLLAERALALGMRVQDAASDDLAGADFVVIDAPAGDASQVLVGEAEFARMKTGVRVVSLAPASVVDYAAWARAVAVGKVAASAVALGAGELDVAAPLAAHGRVLFAPRLEESTVDARVRAGRMVAEQVAAALRGDFPCGAVNVPDAGDDAEESMPHLGLCTQLGRLIVQLAGGPVDDVRITYGGSFAYFDTRLLTLGVLSGVLAGRTDGVVNYVNAQGTADALGVRATEDRQTGAPDFPRVIEVAAEGPAGEVSVAGSSLGGEHKPRIVRVFGEDVDIVPAPRMAFLRYVDAPGVGGRLGTRLGEWNVNIGHMSVGRGHLGDEAVMALTLDQPLSASQVDELVDRCGLRLMRMVEL